MNIKIFVTIAFLAIFLMPVMNANASGTIYHIEDSDFCTLEISKPSISLYEYFWINATGTPNTWVPVALLRYISGNYTSDAHTAIGTAREYFFDAEGFSSKKYLLTTEISGAGNYSVFVDSELSSCRIDFVVCANETIRANYYERAALDANVQMSGLYYTYHAERDHLQNEIFQRDAALIIILTTLFSYAVGKKIITRKHDEEATE
jgi:hypothetical protein